MHHDRIFPNNKFGGLFSVFVICVVLLGCAHSPDTRDYAREDGGAHLESFRSNWELWRFLRERIPSPAPTRYRGSGGVAEVLITGSLIAGSPSITNTQEAGVDEGDIVKMHGENILVILRRGRLFTVSIENNGLRPVDSIDAYPPGLDASDDWYDEMLVADGRIVVIGFSYSRSTSDINRFRIDDSGRMEFEDSYQLRSDDYYSSRNYASRLIGNNLVLFSAREFPYYAADPFEVLPAIRRWVPNETHAPFERIVSARQTYIPRYLRENKDIDLTLYTAIECDLLSARLDCEAKSLIGPQGNTFYVSARAFYLWTTAWYGQGSVIESGANSMLFRVPLDGSPPYGIAARGAPNDQFSFREDYETGVLNVIVASHNDGGAFWRGESTEGEVALISLPLSEFGDGSREIDASRYRLLPSPDGRQYFSRNRFVGDYLLYNLDTESDEDARRSTVVAVPVAGGQATLLPLGHATDRIDIMGEDAVIVGTDRWDEGADLYFSTIELSDGARPALGAHHIDHGAEQAESRSHAFYYLPDPADPAVADHRFGESGVIGLPIARPGRGPFQELYESSAAMIFVRRAAGTLTPLGEIPAHSERVETDDGCVASCADWYGNARPIFVNGRVFALLGYEIAEARLSETALEEIARTDFSPATNRRQASNMPD